MFMWAIIFALFPVHARELFQILLQIKMITYFHVYMNT